MSEPQGVRGVVLEYFGKCDEDIIDLVCTLFPNNKSKTRGVCKILLLQKEAEQVTVQDIRNLAAVMHEHFV